MAAARTEHRLDVDGEEIIVVRSARRRRTVTADLVGGMLRIQVPARLPEAEVRRHARAFRRKLQARQSRSGGGDAQLQHRAQQLSAQYLDGIPQPTSVRWSQQQLRRWGSATSSTGTIRLSARLRTMPDWVVDAVLVHELAHLIEPGHGPAFQQLVARYPRTREADAFLEGVSWAEQHLDGGQLPRPAPGGPASEGL
ncbi:M48 family metallopeptidase [Nesterenkonia alba]|uniref:M48 metallopeptidase family protein n=1 Tax=Nesterenkonia alba TaxID=515814 RepID=UPI0003B64B44|nr:M48 family metallopeptidase [Nesterenkonia alba]